MLCFLIRHACDGSLDYTVPCKECSAHSAPLCTELLSAPRNLKAFMQVVSAALLAVVEGGIFGKGLSVSSIRILPVLNERIVQVGCGKSE